MPSTLATHRRGFSGALTDSKVSPAIWADLIDSDHILQNGVNYYGDNFMNAPVLSASANTGQYASYLDTGGTIVPVATEVGGVLKFTLDTTDNDESWITTGGNSGVLGKILASAPKKMWFEARFKASSVTNNVSGFFVGLAAEGLAAANTLTDAGALADNDFLGFFRPEGDGDGLDIVFKKASGTMDTTAADAATLVADTYVKAGFVYDPGAAHKGTQRIKFFINNVEVTSYVTDTDLADTTNFPGGEELAFLCGVKNGGVAANSISIDWWHFAQER